MGGDSQAHVHQCLGPGWGGGAGAGSMTDKRMLSREYPAWLSGQEVLLLFLRCCFTPTVGRLESMEPFRRSAWGATRPSTSAVSQASPALILPEASRGECGPPSFRELSAPKAPPPRPSAPTNRKIRSFYHWPTLPASSELVSTLNTVPFHPKDVSFHCYALNASLAEHEMGA